MDEVALRGADHLARAGRRALSRDDIPAAIRLLSRASGLLPHDHDDQPSLLLDLAEGYVENQQLDRALRLAEDAATRAERRRHAAWEARARVQILWLRSHTDPEFNYSGARSALKPLIQLLEKLGDRAGLAAAWQLEGSLLLNLGRSFCPSPP